MSASAAGVHLRDLVKPKMRGVLHQWAAVVSLVTGIVLVSVADGEHAKVATGIYGLSVTALFTTSALYHRVTWRPQAREVMKRLDHSMIFILIAGTYTPFALLALHGTSSIVVLSVVWGGAALGVGLRLLWLHAPRFLIVPIYLALGWLAAFIVPQLIVGGGITAFVLVCVGGLLYTLGAVVYATRRPNPSPSTFGYHEVFHAFTLGAALLHYIAVFFAVYH